LKRARLTAKKKCLEKPKKKNCGMGNRGAVVKKSKVYLNLNADCDLGREERQEGRGKPVERQVNVKRVRMSVFMLKPAVGREGGPGKKPKDNDDKEVGRQFRASR